MRRLLASTALAGWLLSASPAVAGPAIPIIAAVPTLMATTGAISAFAGFALSAGITLVGTLAFQPKLPKPEIDGSRTHQVRQPITDHELAVGLVKKSGAMTFAHSRQGGPEEGMGEGPDNILHEVIPTVSHPVRAVLEHWLDDHPVVLDENGVATNDRWKEEDGIPLVRLFAYDGTQTAADPKLVEVTEGKWTDAHVGYGATYGHVFLVHGSFNEGPKVFPNGLPAYRMTVEGAEVFDPRDTGTAIQSSAAGAPGVITATGHGLSVGDPVFVRGHEGADPPLVGMYRVRSVPDADTLTIGDWFHMRGDGMAIATGGSGGTLTRMRWTDNAVLVTAWYMTVPRKDGGPGVSPTRIDWDLEAAEADEADVIVPRRDVAAAVTVDADTDALSVDGVDPQDGARVQLRATGTLPTPLEAGTDYWWIRTGEGTGQLAATKAQAVSRVAIDLSDEGTGTHELLMRAASPVEADADTNLLTVAEPSIALLTGTRVRLETTGTLPSGLSTDASYYWIWTGTDAGGLATSLDAARRRQFVALGDAGTGDHTIVATGEPRWTINGTINKSIPPKQHLQKMKQALGHGHIVRVGGIWRILSGRWREPSAAPITDDDLREGRRVLSDGIGRKENANGMRGTFISPVANWQPTDLPPVLDPGQADTDGGEAWGDAELPFTISPYMGQRILKIEREKRRRARRAELPCKPRMIRAWQGQIVRLDLARYRGVGDWPEEGKAFEIDVAEIGANYAIDLKLSETGPGIWAWDALTDERDMEPSPTPVLPEGNRVAAVTDVVATSDADTVVNEGGGNQRARIYVSWAFPDGAYATGFELFADLVGEEELPRRITAMAPPDERGGYIDGVDWGKLYAVSMRPVKGAIRGNLVVASGSPVLVIGDQTPPAAPTGVTANAISATEVEVGWVTPSDADFERSRLYRATVNDFGAAVLLDPGALFANPGWADSVRDTTATGLTDYWYFVTALDRYGNESAPSDAAWVKTP